VGTALVLCGTAAAQAPTPTASPAAAGVPSLITPGERAAAATIHAERLRGRIRFLSHDLLEGRAPATRGDRLAQAYIAAEMEGAGLEPAAPGGGWFQPFEIVRMESHCPATFRFVRGDDKLELRFNDDFIAFSGAQAPEARLDGAEIVFVGFGIVAPEFEWDDYKGADLRGKVLLMMNNDPEDDPALFAGKTRLYYGRWDYKYEIAEKLGAQGAIIIHTEPSAGYKWQVIQSGWIGERFDVPSAGGIQVKAWATEDASRRIARLGGQDLDALRAAAQKRDFRPVPLGVSLSLRLTNDLSRQQTANVIGRLAGRDPLLSKQAVLYTAHHDHLGTRAGTGDTIYNGALDNATGVAGILSIADAFRALRQPPRRSVYFAAVAAEEQGLLGSKFLAEHPPLSPGRIAANVNVDGLGIWGRTKDLTMIGLGKSNLDDFVKALLAWQGRHVVPDQFPDKGFFYRSDQFSFAKIGVPAAFFDAGTEVIGKPPGWGKQAQQEYEDRHYHQPSDELKDDWNFEGAVEDTQFLFYLGLKLANSQRMPVWKVGDEFEAARKKALAELKD
jgi:Zn-dependent M28 family amino/carboxypeptidase